MTRQLTLDCSVSDVELWPIEIIGYEAYSDPGEFEIIALSSSNKIDVNGWLGMRLRFSIAIPGQGVRDLSGHIVEITALNKCDYDCRFYYFKVSSWLVFLGLAQHNRCFYTGEDNVDRQNLDQILNECFKPYTFPSAYESNTFLKATTIPPYIVQYNENDLAFITRLLASVGVVYWIEHDREKQNIKFYGEVPTYKQVVDYYLYWPDEESPSDHPSVLLDAQMREQVVAHAIDQKRYDYTKADHLPVERELVKGALPDGVKPTLIKYEYPARCPLRAAAQQERQEQITLTLRSQVAQVGIGQILKLAGPVPGMSGEYYSVVPTRVKHYAKDVGGLPFSCGKANRTLLPAAWCIYPEAHYENEIKAIPWAHTPYYPRCTDNKFMAGYQIGFVAGHTKGDMYTDPMGRVKVWFPWDANNPQRNPNLCPWVRVKQAITGNGWGHQFLPHVGDEVTVMYINDDPNEPIIVGSQYNSEAKPPFDIKADNTLSGFKTKNHTLMFRDKPGEEHIVLCSGGDLKEVVGGDFNRTIGGSDKVTITGDALTEVLAGGYSVSANKSICLQSGDTRVMITEEGVELSSPEVKFVTQGSVSAHSISYKGAAHECSKRNADGSSHKGGPIKQGSPDVFIGGKPVARVGDTAECNGPDDTLAQGHPNFFVNGRQVVCKTHETAHGGKVTEGAEGVGAGSDASLVPEPISWKDRHAVGIRFKTQAIPNMVVLRHLFTLDSRSIYISSHEPETVVDDVAGGTVQCSLAPYHRQLDIIAVNQKFQLPYYKTPLQMPDAPVNGDELDESHRFDCDLLWPMIIHDIRPEDEGINDKPATTDSQQEKQDYHQITQEDIQYFQRNGNNVTVFLHGYNVKIGEFDRQIERFETAMETVKGAEEAVTTDPRSAMATNMAAEAIKDTPAGVRPILSSHYATVYRDQNILQKQCQYTLPKDYVKADRGGDRYIEDRTIKGGKRHINATGSRNWAINMEYNLNMATGGQFKLDQPEDYKKYTRLLHVTWKGDPAKSVDYMAAVGQSFQQGEQLAELLVKLKSAGLQVNLIAHSLGNAVLVTALEKLGKENPDTIDHAFMWEAAIPNDVFSRPKPKAGVKDPCYLPNAINGAKKFTVLYSQNDNIVGPIPESQPIGVTQQDVNRAKPFMTELVPAYVLKELGFGSLYHFAMWVGTPASMMQEYSNLQFLYKEWLTRIDQKYVAPKDLKTDDEKRKQTKKKKYFLLPTLDEQIKFDPEMSSGFAEEIKNKLINAMPRLKQVFNDAGWGSDAAGSHYIGDMVLNLVTGALEHPKFAIAIINALVPVTTLELTTGEHFVWEHFKSELMGIGCIIKMMERTKAQPQPGMGSAGPDDNTIRKYGDKIIKVPQAKWLWSHSGMKIPSKDLIKNIYESIFFGSNGLSGGFGTYK
jgi:type VI secretion system secreted protein VgrG